MNKALYEKILWDPRAIEAKAATKWGGTWALCCCIASSWCFLHCLVSSENSLPNNASVVDGDLLKFAACMPWGCWCATDGLCNWHSVQSQRGLLKSASSPFELFAVTGSIRETRPDQKNMPNHSILHPHDILSRVDEGAQLDLREKHSSSMRVCQTPADFPEKML